MIWRSLDPKLLGDLLLDMATALATKRGPAAQAQTVTTAFRDTQAAAKSSRRSWPSRER